VGQKVVTRNCKGYLPSQVAFCLQTIHIGPRKVCTTGTAPQHRPVSRDVCLSGSSRAFATYPLSTPTPAIFLFGFVAVKFRVQSLLALQKAKIIYN
jgi:hypothetical protein